MPKWMRWIESVKTLDDPDLTDWTLAAQGFRFHWKARITQRVEAQQLHWESVGGLPTKGAVRFYPESADRTVVKLSVSYELPRVLAPLMEPSILGGLSRRNCRPTLTVSGIWWRRGAEQALNSCLLVGLLALAACGGGDPPAVNDHAAPGATPRGGDQRLPLRVQQLRIWASSLCRRCSRSVRRHRPGARIRFSRCRGCTRRWQVHLVPMEPSTPPPV